MSLAPALSENDQFHNFKSDYSDRSLKKALESDLFYKMTMI